MFAAARFLHSTHVKICNKTLLLQLISNLLKTSLSVGSAFLNFSIRAKTEPHLPRRFARALRLGGFVSNGLRQLLLVAGLRLTAATRSPRRRPTRLLAVQFSQSPSQRFDRILGVGRTALRGADHPVTARSLQPVVGRVRRGRLCPVVAQGLRAFAVILRRPKHWRFSLWRRKSAVSDLPLARERLAEPGPS